MAAAVIQAVGAKGEGAANVAYTIPSGHQADDILVLPVECAESAGASAPSGGWAHITGSPFANAGSNVTCLNVFWLRATSGSTTNPTVIDPGNHQVGGIIVVRGAITSGSPFDFTPPTGIGGAGQTSISISGASTVTAETLVFFASAWNVDLDTAQYSSVSNSGGGLTGFAEQFQYGTLNGNGGGVAVWAGTKNGTGTIGTTTGSMSSQAYSATAFAIKPAVAVARLPNIRSYNPAVQRSFRW